MIVEFSGQDGLRLTDADNFRAFKVVLNGAFDTMQPDISGVVFVDDGNALVRRDLVPSLAGASASEEWKAGYAKMLESAAKYGWIDEGTGSIRAHVERAD